MWTDETIRAFDDLEGGSETAMKEPPSDRQARKNPSLVATLPRVSQYETAATRHIKNSADNQIMPRAYDDCGIRSIIVRLNRGLHGLENFLSRFGDGAGYLLKYSGDGDSRLGAWEF